MNNVPCQKHKRNAIVLVVDGLHVGFIGAYGNSSVMTPALDRFACDAFLCDRYYTNTLDLSLLYREFWYGILPEEPEEETPPLFPNLPRRLEEKGYRTILLTDDPEIAYNLYANGFSEVHNMDQAPPPQPVASLEETQFFRMFATIVDLVEEKDSPYFLWCHFKSFAGPWDFPLEYRNEYAEEGDPDVYGGVAVPKLVHQTEDPDVRQSVTEAYSGGVTVLDEAFAGFLESLTGGDLGKNTLTIFTASRGFSLGEHRLIGLPDLGDLWGENLHIPCMVRLPEQLDGQRMVRSDALAQPSDVFTALSEWFGLSSEKSLLGLLVDETASLHNEIHITGDSTISAVMQSDWFFRLRTEMDEFQEKRQRIELYAKPGDRYEVNEVADRCEEIVEEFMQRVVVNP